MHVTLGATARAGTAAIASLTALTSAPTASARTARHPTGATETCAHQSGASFPHAFTSRANLVVGPLAMIGGRRLTNAAIVERFDGQKFPLLVAAGHTVTVELTRATHRFASLSYGSHGRTGHRVITFRACDGKDAASDADGRPVTFWSGFVRATRPGCVALRIWVDDARTPQRRHIALGRRC